MDYRQADLTVPERALCDFAVRLTLAPASMSEADIRRLKDNGFSEEQITITTQVVSYFNYINRIADGLGVDVEDWMNLSHDDWNHQRGKNYLGTIDS